MRAPALLLCALLAVPACDSDDGDDGQPLTLTLSFEAFVGDEAAACGPTYAALGATSTRAQLADARLFVSDLQLRSADGTWVALQLDQDTIWQHDAVALLDFEDGTGPCADSGTPAQNSVVTGTAPAGTYDAVRFTVGVPYALNHIDNAAAPAPLNSPGMFWVWRGGYKFVRVDFAPADGAVPRWNVHIGSTGCASAAPTSPPDEPCARTNAAAIELTGFDPAASVIALDLAELVAGADLGVNLADSPPGCMSDPGEADDCSPVFSSLGVDFANGASPSAGVNQSVFSVQ